MELILTPELEALIQDKVASGRYLDASDVVREALRLFEVTQAPFESPELEAAMLEAVEGPHYPLTEELLEDIRSRAKLAR